MPIFIEKFPPRAAQSPDAFGSQGDPAAHPDPMVQQVLERAKEESRATDMLERQLELDKRLQSFDAAYKQKYQGKAAVNADLVYDNMSEATLKEFSKGMSAKQMVDFRDQTWPQRSSFLGSGIDYGIAQDEAHKEDTGNAFLTRTLEIAKNPNLPQRDKDAAWNEYLAGRSKIQQRPDAAWQDDENAFKAARREGVLQRGLALAKSDPARAQGVFANPQMPAEFTGFFAEEEWQDASAQVLKAVGRARLQQAYAELGTLMPGDESLQERIKAFGLDADQEVMLGGMLEAKQKQADAATRKEREANLASLASGVLELAEGTAEQGPDLPAAYMLLAESDLDEATKSAALAGMRNGSFGQAEKPGAVDALTQQILSGQAGQAELATALLSGQISAQSQANLAQLHEEAGGELGPILRAWGNMAQGDVFELGVSIIRQKYEAGGLAAAAPWLVTSEAAQVAALSPAARPDDWASGPLVADASGKTMLPAQEDMPIDLAMDHSAGQLMNHLDKYPKSGRFHLDEKSIQAIINTKAIHDRILGSAVQRGGKDGRPAYQNTDSPAAQNRQRAMYMAICNFKTDPTKREQIVFYAKHANAKYTTALEEVVETKEISKLKSLQQKGEELSHEQLVRLEPIPREKWNEDYEYYRPDVPYREDMTEEEAKAFAEASDYMAIISEAKAYIEELDPSLLGKIARSSGDYFGDIGNYVTGTLPKEAQIALGLFMLWSEALEKERKTKK